MTKAASNSSLVKKLAGQHGFDFCGLSKAEFLEEEAPRLERWLKAGRHAEMKYLENYFDKRLDPRLLVPGAKTVISLMFNYYPEETLSNSTYKLAKYAYGNDYHEVIKIKCRNLLADIQLELGDFNARVFVDSAPVMERAWAAKSGLGWIGKHGLLINKSKGSFFFLAEIICDIDCMPDTAIKDYCGSCTKCVDACPTDAILPDKTLNAGKCISYLTIELKNEIPVEFKGKMEDWIFGCDICQDVCPWNRFSSPGQEQEFFPKPALKDMQARDWEEITETVFQKLFKRSAVKRTGFKGLSRNIKFLKKE